MVRRSRLNNERSRRRVTVYLTDTEKQQLEQQSGGLSLSDYLRRSALGLKRPVPVPAINRQCYEKVSAMAESIEAIAALCTTALQTGQPLATHLLELKQFKQTVLQLQWDLINPSVRQMQEDEKGSEIAPAAVI